MCGGGRREGVCEKSWRSSGSDVCNVFERFDWFGLVWFGTCSDGVWRKISGRGFFSCINTRLYLQADT